MDFINTSEPHEKDLKVRLNSQLKWIAEQSPFYQNLIGNKTLVEASQTGSVSGLPYTTKKDLLNDQANYAPFGSNICVDLNEVSRIHKTSGTTQKPLIIILTKSDLENSIRAGGIAFQAAGLKPDDIVAHCLNYCMWSGGLTDHQCLEATGASVVPYGVGNSTELIEMIISLGVTAIHCTPSYLTKLWDIITQEFELDPKDLPLRLGLFGAEPGLQYPGRRQQIEQDWGIKAMNANYGISEVLSIIGSECEARDGLHFMGEDSLIAELYQLEPDQYIPLRKGAVGELTLTNILKKAQPLIRYRTADIVEIVDTDLCTCGRSSFRFHIKGRSDDMIVVGGINVFPSAVERIISEFLDLLNGEYQIVLSTPPPHDNLLIRGEYRYDVREEKIKELKATMEKVCRSKLGFRPNIELLRNGALPRVEGKAQRIIKEY